MHKRLNLCRWEKKQGKQVEQLTLEKTDVTRKAKGSFKFYCSSPLKLWENIETIKQTVRYCQKHCELS